LQQELQKLEKEYNAFGEAGKEHLKAKKVKAEIDKVQEQLALMEKNKKWNADNMCKTADQKMVVSETRETPGPEPRLQGEAVAEGYCEFIEENEDLLESYISLGAEEDLEKVANFLREHGGKLLQGEHAESRAQCSPFIPFPSFRYLCRDGPLQNILWITPSYLLLDCLEKEMNDLHQEMAQSARQLQLLTQLREFSRAAGRPARDSVNPIFQKLIEHEGTRESFDETVQNFIQRVERRAVVKKKEMDAEMEEERKKLNPLGPGGLDPLEVFETLPAEMQIAFKTKDAQRLQAAVEALPEEEARYHLQRCEDSGLWVPSQQAQSILRELY
ncbi:Cdc37, partial [Symbiodinium necroappetens]